MGIENTEIEIIDKKPSRTDPKQKYQLKRGSLYQNNQNNQKRRVEEEEEKRQDLSDELSLSDIDTPLIDLNCMFNEPRSGMQTQDI